HQRRRTRRVHRHRRPLQPERIRHPTRHHTRRRTSQQVPASAITTRPHQRRVLLVDHPHEHTGLATPQRARVNPRVLQRLPRRLQQQPLLRIHRHRLTRADPEKPRVEQPSTLQNPTLPHITTTRHIRIRVIQTLHIPTTIHRKRPHHIPP